MVGEFNTSPAPKESIPLNIWTRIQAHLIVHEACFVCFTVFCLYASCVQQRHSSHVWGKRESWRRDIWWRFSSLARFGWLADLCVLAELATHVHGGAHPDPRKKWRRPIIPLYPRPPPPRKKHKRITTLCGMREERKGGMAAEGKVLYVPDNPAGEQRRET